MKQNVTATEVLIKQRNMQQSAMRLIHEVEGNNPDSRMNLAARTELTTSIATIIEQNYDMHEMLSSIAMMGSENAKLYLENSSDIVDLLAKIRG